jgi:hypothetical protein
MKTRILAILALLASCFGSESAAVVELPVVSASAGDVSVETDLGYTVTVTSFRAALRDLEMTVGGEGHGALRAAALPHPGHSSGGTVTGELSGDFVVEWVGGEVPLGVASLLVGDYEGANFTFRRAGDADGLDPGDPLVGHTLHLEGTATRDEVTVSVSAVVTVDEGTAMEGAVFQLAVTEATTATLALVAHAADPVEGKTLFDGVDFAALADEDGAVWIRPGDPDHNRILRHVQRHDHYQLEER